MSTEVTTTLRLNEPGGEAFALRSRDSDGTLAQGMYLDPEVMGDVLSWYATGGALEETVLDIASGPGRLYKVDVILDSGAPDRYLHIFNALTATGTPVLRALVPAGGQTSIDLGPWGRLMDTGITVALSSTLAAYTAVGSNDACFQVGYF